MEFYRYRPLRYKDSIRLIEILPGTLNDPFIHCYIIPSRLSHTSLKFEALSYTWGDLSDQVTIFCKGASAKLKVTRNCYNALRNLRLEDAVRLIWIDAICINQEDDSERSAQVRMMGSIYHSADRVVVYIGEETAGTRLVFEELYAIQSFGWKGRALPSVEIVQELDKILLRPWFTRVWVAQEVFMAKSVELQCGSAHAPLDILNTCVWGYHGTKITTVYAPFVLSNHFRRRKRKMIASTTEVTEPSTALNLWKVLGETRLLSATDPRDKIFALKAFLPYNGQEIDQVLRYDRNAVTVFTDIAFFLLPHVELSLLLATRRPHRMTVASWVPDWSQDTCTNHKWLNFDDSYEEEDYGQNIKPTVKHAPIVQNETYLGRHFTLRFIKCEDGSCQDKHAVLHLQGFPPSFITSLGATLDFGTARDLCFRSIRGIRKACKKSKGSMADQNSELLSNGHVTPEILEALIKVDENQLTDLLFGGWASVMNEDEWELALSTKNEDNGHLERHLHGCQLFLDDTGQLGLAPEGAHVGDIICMFEGSAPCAFCLLRRRHESGWVLVSGDCYLSGLRIPRANSDDSWGPHWESHDKIEFAIW